MSNSIESAGEPSPERFTIRAALRTDVGLVRSENQDFGTLTDESDAQEGHPGGRLLIVADGMGGHRGGATASRIAGETVKAQYLGSETTDIAAALRDALSRANARIYSESQSNPDLRGMGTTTSALAVRGEEAWFAHVGDSRIYLVRKAEIRQLTDDHSLVASMVREGLLTPKEAEHHPRRNVLQRSMGVAEDVDVDVSGPIKIEEGDTFILCSDGLHGLVKEAELQEVAARGIDEAADEFVRLTLERGAPDNVTVIVARVEREKVAVVVDALEDTHRGDGSPYDETMRDAPARGATAPAAPAPATADPAPAPAEEKVAVPPVVEAPAAEAVAVRPEPPSVPTPPLDTPQLRTEMRGDAPSTTPLLKWMVLLVVVLVVAGAVFYWIR